MTARAARQPGSHGIGSEGANARGRHAGRDREPRGKAADGGDPDQRDDARRRRGRGSRRGGDQHPEAHDRSAQGDGARHPAQRGGRRRGGQRGNDRGGRRSRRGGSVPREQEPEQTHVTPPRSEPPPPERPILDIRGLYTQFPAKAGAFRARRQMVRAVDGVSFQLHAGETMGLVGESGCGKTTVGRSILRLYQPQAGRVFLEPAPELVRRVTALDAEADALQARWQQMRVGPGNGSGAGAGGEFGARLHTVREARELRTRERRLRTEANQRAATTDILAMPRARLKQARRRLQMVFQDPWASLNPRMLVHDLIAEGPREFGTHTGPDLATHVRGLLDRVGLPQSAGQRYPHEFSGGQRQRIGIARALALSPSVVIADEPVSALDVSIQAQILNLLIELQDELGLTYIFIAHDLAVVRYIAHRIAVMYLGKIVELGSAEEITDQPRHPYTISLMASVPVADPDMPLAGTGARAAAQGEVPSPVNPPSGCPFHPRCASALDICSQRMPTLEVDRAGRALACHNPPPPEADPTGK